MRLDPALSGLISMAVTGASIGLALHAVDYRVRVVAFWCGVSYWAGAFLAAAMMGGGQVIEADPEPEPIRMTQAPADWHALQSTAETIIDPMPPEYMLLRSARMMAQDAIYRNQTLNQAYLSGLPGMTTRRARNLQRWMRDQYLATWRNGNPHDSLEITEQGKRWLMLLSGSPTVKRGGAIVG